MSLKVDIRKNLGAFTVDARFDTTRGITALFGKSGAGKTSIVQMLAGLIAPDNGYISIDGNVVFDSAVGADIPPERRRVGYVFQDARLFPHMSVRRNLEYGARRQPGGGETPVRFDSIVDVLGIGGLLDRRTHRLSGGERQRVAIGRALLSAPKLLLMDEPLAALDAARKAEIIPFIGRLRREFDIPIVYVSHAVDEVLQLADTMVLVAEGGVVATGPVEDVMNRPDLVRITGTGDAGTVIPARVVDRDAEFGIASLSFAGGTFRVPAAGLTPGERLRLRVRARDVSIALKRPEDVSVLNIFAGTVASVSSSSRPQTDVSIDVGGTIIWSQITRKSLAELGIVPGKQVFTMVKAVAIDQPVAHP